MTQGNKDLLFKDLCGRLPYGVKVEIYNHWRDDYEDETLTLENYAKLINTFSVKDIKPYLFPISSMTEVQKNIYSTYIDELKRNDGTYFETIFTSLQFWLNANHFDYRGLIPMELANDATGLNIY